LFSIRAAKSTIAPEERQKKWMDDDRNHMMYKRKSPNASTSILLSNVGKKVDQSKSSISCAFVTSTNHNRSWLQGV